MFVCVCLWLFVVCSACLAQLVERKTLNLVVVGSSPTVGTAFAFVLCLFLLLFLLLCLLQPVAACCSLPSVSNLLQSLPAAVLAVLSLLECLSLVCGLVLPSPTLPLYHRVSVHSLARSHLVASRLTCFYLH